MSIITTHPQYALAQARWMKNRDFCGGEMPVKLKGREYLPDDNAKYIAGVPQNESISGPADDPYKYERKYQNYLRRAPLLTIAQHTRNGLTGMVFNEMPVYQIAPELEFIIENADGSGQSLIQTSKHCVSEVLEVGRVGLLSDMPSIGGAVSRAEEQALNIRPRILVYTAENIVDWDEDTIGSRTFLNYVKLREAYYERDNYKTGYGSLKYRYRVLELVDGVYNHSVFDENGKQIGETVQPKVSGGAAFDYLPFHFIGAENNKPDVDDAPLSGIVDINASHYINSADNEQLNHLYSLATPHLDVGVNQTSEAFQAANPRGIEAGQGVVTQGGGTFTLNQIQANGSLSELIDKKEAQAEKIGARFAGEGNSKDVTAEAARMNAAFTTATLTTVVGNVSEGIEAALEDCAVFIGVSVEAIEFNLNTSFYGQQPNFELGAFYNGLYDVGRITWDNYVALMSSIGIEIDGEG